MVGQLEQLCELDRRFGATIFDDGILGRTMTRMKVHDASNLYHLGSATPELAEEDVDRAAVVKKDFGRALLRLISVFFENRYELYEKRVEFLKIFFSFLENDPVALKRHETEFKHHFLRLQTFFMQFPKVAPRVGEFRYFRSELKKLAESLLNFRFDQVEIVFANAESVQVGGHEHANVATLQETDSCESPPRKLARVGAESATNTPGDEGSVSMMAITPGDEGAVPMTALQASSTLLKERQMQERRLTSPDDPEVIEY